MANKNFPGPNINRIIEKDPQIVKINLDIMEYGSRMSAFAQLTGSAETPGGDPSPPAAPEMTVKHTN